MEPNNRVALLLIVMICAVMLGRLHDPDDAGSSPVGTSVRTGAAASSGSPAVSSAGSPSEAVASLPASPTAGPPPDVTSARPRTAPSRGPAPSDASIVTVSSLQPPPATPTSGERDFMDQAAGQVLLDASAARLARDRALDASLIEYADAFAAQRQAVHDDLVAYAHMRSLRPPATMDRDQQQQLDRVARLRGHDFERALLELIGHKSQQSTIRLFEGAARSSKDPTLKAWIDKTLPALRSEIAYADALPPPGVAPQRQTMAMR